MKAWADKHKGKFTAPLAFTANDCLDFGSDLGSPVSLDYFDKAPFKFNGILGTSTIEYVK